MRDLYRPGSGMTLRRLGVLIRGLPHNASLWAEMSQAREKSLKPTPEQIRARQARYQQ